MGEKIKSIEGYNDGNDWMSASGYKITTDCQEITMLISDGQRCCERFGYFFCNDDFDEFVGADLLGIELTDTGLNQALMEENEAVNVYDGGIMFVDIRTSEGVLQFVAYNSHNGYYGHEATVKSTQLTHSETI